MQDQTRRLADLDRRVRHLEGLLNGQLREMKDMLRRLVGDPVPDHDDDDVVPDWGGFLDDHPELTQPPPLPAFTDQVLLDALQLAYADRAAYAAERGLADHDPRVLSSDVARALAGGATWQDNPATPVRHGDVIRVGQRLGRLERAGRVRRVNKTWERTSFWAPA